MAFVFNLQTLQLIDFNRYHQLKGLEPKNKDHTNFYGRCDLRKKYTYQISLLPEKLKIGLDYDSTSPT